MKPKQLFQELSHHAYLLIGSLPEKETLILELEKKHKIKAQGNPDFITREFQTLTIDDARELKSQADVLPVHPAGKKVFVLSMNGITIEAQNALLKLLEEPTKSTHFFLIVPSAHLLLPTVTSRLHMIGDTHSGNPQSDADLLKSAKQFLAAPEKDKFEIIKKLMDEISKEKKTKQDALDFLNAIEEQVYASGVKKNVNVLESIILAKKYAYDRAPSMKMLLEYMALNA